MLFGGSNSYWSSLDATVLELHKKKVAFMTQFPRINPDFGIHEISDCPLVGFFYVKSRHLTFVNLGSMSFSMTLVISCQHVQVGRHFTKLWPLVHIQLCRRRGGACFFFLYFVM